MIGEAELARLREALEARPEVAFAYLFGSAAAGRAHAKSDVDLALGLTSDGEGREGDSGGPGLGSRLWVDLLAAAQDALGRENVDLVLLARAPPLLADRIARHGRLVFSRDEARRIRWLARTKSRYCDLRPLRDLLDRSLERRVRRGDFGRAPPGIRGG